MHPRFPDITNNILPKLEELPDFSKKNSRQLRSLINKASGNNHEPYLQMLFPFPFNFSVQNKAQEKLTEKKEKLTEKK